MTTTRNEQTNPAQEPTQERVLRITIEGPSSSGKSTLAHLLVNRCLMLLNEVPFISVDGELVVPVKLGSTERLFIERQSAQQVSALQQCWSEAPPRFEVVTRTLRLEPTAESETKPEADAPNDVEPLLRTSWKARAEAAEGKLDIILRENNGGDDVELAIQYGGLGWENDEAVISARVVRKERDELKKQLAAKATSGHNSGASQSTGSKPERVPTIGRIVHYTMPDAISGTKVFPAIITAVLPGRVRLLVFDDMLTPATAKETIARAGTEEAAHCWSWPL